MYSEEIQLNPSSTDRRAGDSKNDLKWRQSRTINDFLSHTPGASETTISLGETPAFRYLECEYGAEVACETEMSKNPRTVLKARICTYHERMTRRDGMRHSLVDL